MKRACGHLVAIVILTLVFPVLDAVQGPSGWGRLVASADRPPQARFFEVPIQGPLPEALNYMP